MSANLIEKTSDKLKLSEKEYQARLEIENFRKIDFEGKLFERLKQAYIGCKKLADDSNQVSWGDIIQKSLKESAELTMKVASAGGVAYLVGGIIGGKNNACSIGTGVGLSVALLTLWNIKHEKEAIERARKFLAMVEDIKNNQKQIDYRLKQIACALSTRFECAIRRLDSSDVGIGLLATFFSTAIIRDFPISIENNLKIPKEKEIIEIVCETAVPKNEEDELYKGKLGHLTLRTDDNRSDWTLPGLLLRSPIWNTFDKKYYVRFGGKDKSKKYPVQSCNQRPSYYVPANEVQIGVIKSNMKSPELFRLEEVVKELRKRSKGPQATVQTPQVIQEANMLFYWKRLVGAGVVVLGAVAAAVYVYKKK